MQVRRDDVVQAGRRGLGPHVRVQPRLQVTRRPGAHTHAHTHTLVSPPPSRARTLHTNIHAHTHDIFFIDNDNHHNTYMIYMPVASAGLLCAVPPVTVYDYVTTYQDVMIIMNGRGLGRSTLCSTTSTCSCSTPPSTPRSTGRP